MEELPRVCGEDEEDAALEEDISDALSDEDDSSCLIESDSDFSFICEFGSELDEVDVSFSWAETDVELVLERSEGLL